jgi:membrane associated rhomboid family serine protease
LYKVRLTEEISKNQDKESSKFAKSLIIPFTFVLFLWAIYFSQVTFNLPYVQYGILPRKLSGMLGILSAPLIHASISHILSNTPTLSILSIAIMYFYPSSSLKVFAVIYLLTGILVWLFAREAYHIGASGIIYGLLSFLFFSGVFRRDNRSIALALLVTFIYGGLVWGILPGAKGISWESHLFGGISGIIVSFIYRKEDPYIKYDWEKEEDIETEEEEFH